MTRTKTTRKTKKRKPKTQWESQRQRTKRLYKWSHYLAIGAAALLISLSLNHSLNHSPPDPDANEDEPNIMEEYQPDHRLINNDHGEEVDRERMKLLHDMQRRAGTVYEWCRGPLFSSRIGEAELISFGHYIAFSASPPSIDLNLYHSPLNQSNINAMRKALKDIIASNNLTIMEEAKDFLQGGPDGESFPENKIANPQTPVDELRNVYFEIYDSLSNASEEQFRLFMIEQSEVSYEMIIEKAFGSAMEMINQAKDESDLDTVLEMLVDLKIKGYNSTNQKYTGRAKEAYDCIGTLMNKLRTTEDPKVKERLIEHFHRIQAIAEVAVKKLTYRSQVKLRFADINIHYRQVLRECHRSQDLYDRFRDYLSNFVTNRELPSNEGLAIPIRKFHDILRTLRLDDELLNFTRLQLELLPSEIKELQLTHLRNMTVSLWKKSKYNETRVRKALSVMQEALHHFDVTEQKFQAAWNISEGAMEIVDFIRNCSMEINHKMTGEAAEKNAKDGRRKMIKYSFDLLIDYYANHSHHAESHHMTDIVVDENMQQITRTLTYGLGERQALSVLYYNTLTQSLSNVSEFNVTETQLPLERQTIFSKMFDGHVIDKKIRKIIRLHTEENYFEKLNISEVERNNTLIFIHSTRNPCLRSMINERGCSSLFKQFTEKGYKIVLVYQRSYKNAGDEDEAIKRMTAANVPVFKYLGYNEPVIFFVNQKRFESIGNLDDLARLTGRIEKTQRSTDADEEERVDCEAEQAADNHDEDEEKDDASAMNQGPDEL